MERLEGILGQELLVPVLLLKDLPPLREREGALALLANSGLAYTALDRFLLFQQRASSLGINLRDLRKASEWVNFLRNRGDKGELALWLSLLEALEAYNLTAPQVVYYVRALEEIPELFPLLEERRISEKAFRILANRRLRPYLGELLEVVRGGKGEKELQKKAKEIRRRLGEGAEEKAYKLLLKAYRLAGDPDILHSYLEHLARERTGKANKAN